MSKLSNLKAWLESGHEIEFSINGEEYSITYSYGDKDNRRIHLCKFYEKPIPFDSIDELLTSTAINNSVFSELWDNAEDIVVY